MKITDTDYYPVYTISEFKGCDKHYLNGEFAPEQLSADGMLHIVTAEQYTKHPSSYDRAGVTVMLIYRGS